MHSILLVFLALSSLVSSCIGQPARMRFCGKHLSDALMLVCGENGYNAPDWDDDDDDSVTKKPSKPRLYNYVGVATECCYHGCSWRTMATYCAEPSKLLNFGSLDGYGDLAKLAMAVGNGRGRMAAASEEQEEVGARKKRRQGKVERQGKGARKRRGRMGKGEKRRQERDCPCRRGIRARRKRPERPPKVA